MKMEKEERKTYKEDNNDNYNMLPGNPQGLPDESFSIELKETLVFIDSNFLSKLSKYFSKERYLIYDLISFSDNISRYQRLLCKQIFYYTAPPFQSSIPTKIEERKRDGYDRFINKLKKREVIVREGRCQRLKTNGKFEYKQKGVDILLAMDLMSVPLKFLNIRIVILIASDSDFVPVIKNIEEQKVKTIPYTYYEHKRNANFSRSNHLIKSVHKYTLLSKEDFDNAPLIKETKQNSEKTDHLKEAKDEKNKR